MGFAHVPTSTDAKAARESNGFRVPLRY
jgi:hypothetical protein